MAQEMQVKGVNVKAQSLWAVFGLTLITLGIYFLFWYYRINNEMKQIGAVSGDAELGSSSPGMSVFAQFIPIANLVSIHRTGKRIQRAQELCGRGADYSMGVHWLLILFTGLWWLYSQAALNTLWTFTSGGAPGVPAAMPVGTTPG